MPICSRAHIACLNITALMLSQRPAVFGFLFMRRFCIFVVHLPHYIIIYYYRPPIWKTILTHCHGSTINFPIAPTRYNCAVLIIELHTVVASERLQTPIVSLLFWLCITKSVPKLCAHLDYKSCRWSNFSNINAMLTQHKQTVTVIRAHHKCSVLFSSLTAVYEQLSSGTVGK